MIVNHRGTETQTSPRLSASVVKAILTTANLLTVLRIIFVPILIILLVYERMGWALATFVAAGLTDGLDGLIARRFGQKTSIGALLDPIADKLLMTATIVVLSLPQMGLVNTVPRWLMIIVVFRDVFILLGSLIIILMMGYRTFKPSPYGKASTFLQIVTVFAVLFYNWRGIQAGGLDILFYATGFVTVFSGLHYFVGGRRMFGVSNAD